MTDIASLGCFLFESHLRCIFRKGRAATATALLILHIIMEQLLAHEGLSRNPLPHIRKMNESGSVILENDDESGFIFT